MKHWFYRILWIFSGRVHKWAVNNLIRIHNQNYLKQCGSTKNER